MITAYHRPQSLNKAIQLISRESPTTVPLGGGTILSHHRGEAIEVVDLQALGLNGISRRGKTLQVGAMVTLEGLLEDPNCPVAMADALRLEAPLNLRNSSTVAGTIVVCDGRSTFAMVLLSLDARVIMMRPAEEAMNLGEFLALRGELQPGYLITALEFPLGTKIEFECVGRTPVDRPIVAAAVARWPSGRTRLSLAGYGSAPLLAMDGTEEEGLEVAARNAMHGANDPWGSAEYRMELAAVLSRRCLVRLST